MNYPRSGLLLAALALAGCYDGQFLALEPCVSDGDCGRGMECVEGVCGGYTCPVAEVDGVCPCPGRAKYECAELSFSQTNKIDVLFVIDDSQSVAQLGLVKLVGDLVAALDNSLVDYRIAFTTTDVGNPYWCADSSAERGEFVFSSCRERIADFVNGVDDSEQCLSQCKHEVIETAPTANGDSPEQISRPWLEVRPDGDNLPPDVSVDEALACVVMQGIRGCRFGSPLEALKLAIDGAQTPGSPNYGFIRPNAHFIAIIFTNEVDCSVNQTQQAIFDPDGDKLLWPDPDAAEPSQALCWNAGVECLGGPTPYYDCLPVDKATDGTLTLDGEAKAVLYPLSRYIGQFEALRESKQERNDDLEVFVELIAGVPDDYDDGVPLIYSSAAQSDPLFEQEFGIGPACTLEGAAEGLPSTVIGAVPPVRMLDFAEAMRPESDAYNVFSYCEDEFNGAFVGISNALDETVPDLCMPACVKDEGTCELVYRENYQSIDIPRCEIDSQGQPALAGADLCFYSLVGTEAAESCRSAGGNLQFGFLQTEGVDIPAQIWAACAPSDAAAQDCPSG